MTTRTTRRLTPTPRAGLAGLLALAVGASGAAPAEGPARGADVVRATVQIRNGKKHGSGTVIAVGPGGAFVLTAAHVVRDPEGLRVEVHRHNLGPAPVGLTEGGGWPRLFEATVVGSDPGSDVALVRVKGAGRLPYVARVDPGAAEPAPGDLLTSVGVDGALRLTRWRTAVLGSATLDIKQGGGPGRFTITARAPRPGRSGGGLFRDDGAVVGVCTGQLQVGGRPEAGAFASPSAIRRLLTAHGLGPGAGPPPRSAGRAAAVRELK